MTSAVARSVFSPVALISLLLTTALIVIALTATILGGSRVRCPSPLDSSPSVPLAASCAPTAANH